MLTPQSLHLQKKKSNWVDTEEAFTKTKDYCAPNNWVLNEEKTVQLDFTTKNKISIVLKSISIEGRDQDPTQSTSG